MMESTGSALEAAHDGQWAEDADYHYGAAPVIDTMLGMARWAGESDDRLERYAQVVEALEAVGQRTVMAKRQRLRLDYALGLAYVGLGDARSAMSYLHAGEVLARGLGDQVAVRLLAYELGKANRNALDFREATRWHLQALDTFYAMGYVMGGEYSASGFDLSLAILNDLATFTYQTGDLTSSAHYLEDVGLNLSGKAQGHLMAARMERMERMERARVAQRGRWAWTRAVVLRKERKLEQALEAAVVAMQLMLDGGSLAMQGRIHGVAAGIALDLAEAAPERQRWSRRDDAMVRADAYLVVARQKALEAQDAGGDGMALLQYARLQRLQGHRAHQIALINQVAKQAEARHDLALLGQAHVAFGQEFMVLGEYEHARMAFGRAMEEMDTFRDLDEFMGPVRAGMRQVASLIR